MYESVTVHEKKDYSRDRSADTTSPPSVLATFHNSSVIHTTIILTNAKTGTAVEIMLKKKEIPEWVNTPEE